MSISDWDLDLSYGQVGEALVNDLLTGGFTVEVKRDRRWHETGNLYIETHCYYNTDNTWKESGISVTKADYWAFVLGKTVLMLPTKTVVLTCLAVGKSVQCKIEPNPSRGYLVKIVDLIAASKSES
jgi:hypothetical protein